MSGPLYSTKLVCYQGIDFSETFAFFVPPASGSTDVQNQVAVDFTGCTARMNVRLLQDPAATSILTLSSGGTGSNITFVAQSFTPGPATPAYNNGVTITITRTQSLAMNGGVAALGAYYDLFLDQAGGTSVLLLSGQFDLVPTATR